MILFTINKNVLFYKNYNNHVDTAIIYQQISGSLLKGLRMLHLKSKLPLFSIWFTKEFKNAGKTDSEIILFDTILTVPAANYIKRKYPKLRVIYWFWNHIYNPAIFKNLSPAIEKWSYDKEDCKKYKMRYNTQFHFKEVLKPAKAENIEQDFFFIGAEKGRSQYIEKCENVITINSLSKKFIVIGNSRADRVANWMPYEQIIENLKESRCVVDLVPEVQKGLTLRPLEALFLKKKLITNFTQIRDYNFYNPDNIFILGVDDDSKLATFLEIPYSHSVDKYIEEYDFNSWIKRFNKNIAL